MSLFSSKNSSCIIQNQTRACDFAFYYNATSLRNDQKLFPNTDIIGKRVFNVFVATCFLAGSAAFLLLVDEGLLAFGNGRSKSSHRAYRRAIHSLDSILHHLSDTQLIAGISLLVATLFQGCSVSAYHYNLVCYLLLMSLITHAFAVVNIPKFIRKNIAVAVLRLAAITGILALTLCLYRARSISSFPTAPGPLSILPAHCFLNRNLSSLSTSNMTSVQNITRGILPSNMTSGGLQQYNYWVVPLVIVMIFSLILAAADSKNHTTNGRIIWAVRIVLTAPSIIIAIWATAVYGNLRKSMEVDKWYVGGKENVFAFDRILVCALPASSVIPLFRAFQETIDGPRSIPNWNRQHAGALVRVGERVKEDNLLGP